MKAIKYIMAILAISLISANATYAFTVSGEIYDLGRHNTVALQINGVNNMTIINSGHSFEVINFDFSEQFNDGDSYVVTVLSQPTDPDQICVVEGNGSGTIAGENVNNVLIACKPSYPVNVHISGLAPNQTVIFQNNGGDDLSVAVNGKFSFNTPLGSKQAYLVSILSQPSEQVCSISGDSAGIMSSLGTTTTISCTGDVTPNPKDVNGDGAVDIRDIVSVINAVLGQ